MRLVRPLCVCSPPLLARIGGERSTGVPCVAGGATGHATALAEPARARPSCGHRKGPCSRGCPRRDSGQDPARRVHTCRGGCRPSHTTGPCMPWRWLCHDTTAASQASRAGRAAPLTDCGNRGGAARSGLGRPGLVERTSPKPLHLHLWFPQFASFTALTAPPPPPLPPASHNSPELGAVDTRCGQAGEGASEAPPTCRG
jgi:hypothetical protein